MSEQDDQTAPTADNNLLTRHKHIAESIEMIRRKKDQLLTTLRGLSESENPDRALMAKLVDAFDMMTEQEVAFLGVLKNIVDIHEQATRDVAADNEVMEPYLENSTVDKKGEQPAENTEEDAEDDAEMIKQTLKELEQVSLQALAAAELNEKLIESLQHHKKNRNSIFELRKNKTEELKSAASAAMAEVKKAKQEVSLNRAEIQKKQKEAEELRKAALRAGIQVGAEEEKHNEEITAALAAVVNDVERIPPIPVMEDSPAATGEPEDPLEVRRKQIRENIRKEKERKEHVNQKIREKLAAMEARKLRLKEIRRLLAENQASASSLVDETKKKLESSMSHDEADKSLLNGSSTNSSMKLTSLANGTPSDITVVANSEAVDNEEYELLSSSEEQTKRDIEDTFHSAELNLQNLTMLRERLEQIQSKGGTGLSQEDEEFINQLDEAAVSGLDDEPENHEDVHTDEREISIDRPESKIGRPLSRSTTLDETNTRLKHIEQMLLTQMSMISELLQRDQLSNSRRASVVHSSCRLLELLHAASPALLRGLSACLLQLADRHPSPPHLERILNAICENEPQQPGSTTTVQRKVTSQVRHVPSHSVIFSEYHETGDKMKNHLEYIVSSVILDVRTVLEESDVIDEETETRLRESIVLSTAALFPNVPRSLIDGQLGPLVDDVLFAYSNDSTAVVTDKLSAEIARILYSELVSMTQYGPLAEIAIATTVVIVLASTFLSSIHPAIVNAVVLLAVGMAMIVYGFLMDLSFYEFPVFIWRLVFDSTSSRMLLLIFWTLNVIASIAFGVFVSTRSRSSTVHRKFFHLTVSLIYLSGLFFDRDFTWLSGWIMICLFVIIEDLRFFRVPPWKEPLDKFLLPFKDKQDSAILFTPIFLLFGVFLPLFLSPNEKSPHLYHLAGVASVGVGDAIAAIVGVKFGKTKWPRRNKTIEGSVAMAISITIFLTLARPFCIYRAPSCFSITVVAVILAAVEAFIVNVDNIILPIVGYLLL